MFERGVADVEDLIAAHGNLAALLDTGPVEVKRATAYQCPEA
jgi:hypothetical protein